MKLRDPPEWPATVAVVGGGRMGSGIAEAFAVGGLTVRITDGTPERARRARERVIARARTHARAGLVSDEAVSRAERIEPCPDLTGAVADAELVLEAVAEDLEVKQQVLRDCEQAVDAHAVIATNTSSLPVDELAAALRRPERFLGMHWFNPPEWTPGVEVVPVPATDEGVVERVVQLLRELGKSPAVVKPGVGFVANRLQMALLCEAVRCV